MDSINFSFENQHLRIDDFFFHVPGLPTRVPVSMHMRASIQLQISTKNATYLINKYVNDYIKYYFTKNVHQSLTASNKLFRFNHAS